MKILLFDIDGTLIRAGGAGMLAIGEAMRSLYGFEEIPSVPLHGRTDEGILGELFDRCGLDFSEHKVEFSQAYWDRLPSMLEQTKGEILPGVESLIQSLHGRADVVLGLLTGNAKRAAEIKLEHFGLDSPFQFGGFGDAHADRNDVARMALEASKDHLGADFQEADVWVIGDTPNDIRCARSIDANVLAVATGGSGLDVLEAANPDKLMADLSDADAFYEAVELLGS